MLGSLLKYCWQNFSVSITYADRHELAQLVLVPCSCGRSPRYSYRLHDFYVTIPRYFENVFGNSFLPCRSYTLELFACKMLSFDQQFWIKYLQTFPRFSTISLNRKWKGTYVLSWEIECKNYLTSCGMTWLRKRENFIKNPEVRGVVGEYPACHKPKPLHSAWPFPCKTGNIWFPNRCIKSCLWTKT